MILNFFQSLIITSTLLFAPHHLTGKIYNNKTILSAKKIDLKETGNIKPDELVTFAESLIGIPYRYGSSDPKNGFDCSGFISYVFKHYGISVPRSSVNYTYAGKQIGLKDTKRGDLILFTGTNSKVRSVGHIGIITTHADGKTSFIHSTSGKAYSVTVTELDKNYHRRFVKVIRLLE